MFKRVKSVLAIALVIALGLVLPAKPATASAADEQEFTVKLNDLRSSLGLARLTVDPRLTEIAQAWARQMASVGVLSHNLDLAAQVPSGWLRIGENVGYGATVAVIHDAFVASPHHYENMVDPKFNSLGVGVATSGTRVWVAEVFEQAPGLVTAVFNAVTPLVLPVILSGNDWYRLASSGGDTYSFGAASAVGGAAARTPVVSIVGTANGSGSWMAGSDGSVYVQGDARFFGSMAGQTLSQPIVGMAATPTGKGYWLVARDGGIFAFGDATFFGSTGAIQLNRPIVGMTSSPTGKGYWFVAADGGIFSFGDAVFFGSTGALTLNQPVVGMASTKAGKGYWLVARDGGIFSFGDARFFGSTGAIKLNQPIVGMARSASGAGYRFVAGDGGIFSFGDAPFLGSASGLPLPSSVTAIAAAL